jgi:hypothetical protein
MTTPTPKSAYAADVDIDAQEVGRARVKKLAKSTFTLGEPGSAPKIDARHEPSCYSPLSGPSVS